MTLRTITYDPAKWRLVPVEPSDEMIDAFHNGVFDAPPDGVFAGEQCIPVNAMYRAGYKALLAAAPEPPEAEAAGVKVPERHVTVNIIASERDSVDWYEKGRSSGWNACIDEVLRLNAEPAKAEQADHFAGVNKMVAETDSCAEPIDELYSELEGAIQDTQRVVEVLMHIQSAIAAKGE